MDTQNRPSICFATMCKNEEHCIRNTLESVYRYIDTWVVCDTGSTDGTCDIVREFFREKNLPGELFVDEWTGFDVNKTLMMQRAYGRSDYVMHLDADDLLIGEFHFDNDAAGRDAYHMPVRRGSSEFKALILFNNRVHWKFCGVVHTTIKCLDRPYSTGDLSRYNCHVWSRDVGSRSFDPMKYVYDAERLEKQFFDTLVDDPDELNSRSAFYVAQSYMDSGMHLEALQWNRLYLRLKDTWIEEAFEARMRAAQCMMSLGNESDAIVAEMSKAIEIFPDRAEPYFLLGRYLNQVGRHEEAYHYLKTAKNQNLEAVKAKYVLFVNAKCYGKHVYDELSVACYWTDRLDEGLRLLTAIVDDEAFASEKARLAKNLTHFVNKMVAASN